VLSACSEEETTPQPMGGSRYCVTFDPLDGSSIIDTNFAVGTIYGIWDVTELNGCTGRDLAGSAIVVYGPKTTMLLEVEEEAGAPQVDELTLVRGEWITTKRKLAVKSETKLFAPANLRAVNEHAGYRELVSYWESQAYTLRYTGGMVPDIYQIFIKGHGVFSNPATDISPPKLRLLYEAAPIARLMELAGGLSSDG
jgi:sedoheptulose-bisphosphatase